MIFPRGVRSNKIQDFHFFSSTLCILPKNLSTYINSTELIKKLNNIKYVIKYQVSNYQSKCIRVYASKDEKKEGIIVPCSPSALIADSYKIKNSGQNTSRIKLI